LGTGKRRGRESGGGTSLASMDSRTHRSITIGIPCDLVPSPGFWNVSKQPRNYD
jgi:hypothetical protein